MFRYALGLVLAAAVFNAAAEAVVTTIDNSGNVGRHSSLRTTGTLTAISYYDATNGDLKLATCTSGCLGASPSWIITTVDGAGDVGVDSSLALAGSGATPVIAYYDATNGDLRLAMCMAGCYTPTPSWVTSRVDGANADVGRSASLQLTAAGTPYISYYDRTNTDVKVAVCTAGCATTAPTWAISVVDGPGDAGRATALALDSGRPVIAYVSSSSEAIRVATCTAGCDTPSPTWAISTVDRIFGNEDMKIDIALNSGNASVSYYDSGNGNVKVATCLSGCGTAFSTWNVNVADHAGNAGQWSSLAMNGGTPIVAYFGAIRSCNAGSGGTVCHEAGDLRLSICDSNCPRPNWIVSTMDQGRATGIDPSMQLIGDTAIVSFHDAASGDLKLARVNVVDATSTPNYTSLWWDAEESGWGINFTHQGDIVFGTLFTYDSSGQPMWLVMPEGRMSLQNVFSGAIYRTTGPAFDASPFTPIGPSNITQVGNMAVSFAGNAASLTYTFNGATVNKTLRRQVFGARAAACHPTYTSRSLVTNYQDLWWNPSESGWGINFTHQGNIIFATLFSYDASGRAAWFVMPSGARQSDGSYGGALYTVRGTAFNAVPFQPITESNSTQVGTMNVRLSDGEHGTLTYSVNGATVVKAIQRQVFGTPVPACA